VAKSETFVVFKLAQVTLPIIIRNSGFGSVEIEYGHIRNGFPGILIKY
jgi:hypothetical protein